MDCFVIAVDGTAASGKGTLAKKLSDHFGFDHLDTGLIYRKTAFFALDSGIDVTNPIKVVECIRSHDITADVHEPLHTEQISSAASVLAAFKEVREALYQTQRGFANGRKGAVIDGRDIGTVIFPDANIKLFITAELEIRAKRRFQQLQNEGKEVIFDEVLKNLRERDLRDSKRTVAPTVAAEDAIVIDSTNLDANSVLKLVISLCHKTVSSGLKAA